MLCEVDAGAMVIADAFRSVGLYVGLMALSNLYVDAPASGDVPDQANP
jgi:hypothetical protein